MAKNDAIETTEAKTFTGAGTSVKDGQKTFRFFNGKANLRTNMLNFSGHEDVNLVDLPKAMTKIQATAWLLQNMKGCKDAVIPTRSADKTRVTGELEQARELAAKQKAQAKAREEKKAAKATPATAAASTPKVRGKRERVAA